MSAALESDDLRSLAVRLVAISEMLEQRSEHAVRRVEHSAVALEHASQLLGSSGDRLVRELVDTLRQQGAAAVNAGLAEALARCRKAFDAAEAQAGRAAHDWGVQNARLASTQRRLMWGGTMALIVGSVLAVGGSVWVVREHMRQLEQARFAEDILAATRSGAITRCGDRLCVRTGAKAKPHGTRGEYVIVPR